MKSRRLEQESFRKRKNNFIRRGHEISDRYKVGVWICIQKDNGQLYVYNSNPTQIDWPPSSTQLESMYPAPIIKTSRDFLSRKPALQRSPLHEMDTSLPGFLSTPPVPDYDQGEMFRRQLLEITKN